MAQELINIGTTANDGTGDTIRGSGLKINNNFTEIYARPHFTLTHIEFSGNQIKGLLSNADIELQAVGTGTVTMPELTIDSTVNMSDNEIKVDSSNSDLVLTANGTGSIVFENIDVNSGNIDNVTIGATSPETATFSTLNVNTSASLDGITISDNSITTTSNADLQLSGSGTGTVSFNGVKWPTSDGSANQVLKTNGSGQLSYFTSPILFDVTNITDGTATVLGSSSSVQVIDTFSASTFRSAKYTIQISDSTDDRYRLIEANVTHNGSDAFISVFGGVDNCSCQKMSVTDF